MHALLKRQQQKHESAGAASSSLLERTRRQELQQKAGALHWQWRKTYIRLRSRQRSLSYELKELLASQDLLFSDCSSAALETTELENAASPTPGHGPCSAAAVGGDEPSKPSAEHKADSACGESNATTATSVQSICCMQPTQLALSAGQEAEQPVGVARWASAGRSPERTESHFEGVWNSIASLMQLMRQCRRGTNVAAALPGPSGSVSSPKPTVALPAEEAEGPSACEEQPWIRPFLQVAGCLFQMASSMLQEDKTVLDNARVAATAGLAAALAALRDDESLYQRAFVPLVMRKSLHAKAQGAEQSLTDAEDAVLHGEASEVRAAAEAESELQAALALGASAPGEHQQQHQQQHSARPSRLRLLLSRGRRASAATGGTPSCGRRPSDSEGAKSVLQSLQDVLVGYSRRLLALEESHTKELEQHQQQLRQHKAALRRAVAELLTKPLQQGNSSYEAGAAATCCPAEAPPTPAAAVGPECPEGEAEQKTATQSETKSAAADAAAAAAVACPPCSASEEKTAPQCAAGDEPPACGIAEEGSPAHESGKPSHEEAVSAALVSVRWLSVSLWDGRAADEERRNSLLRRLQLVFPAASPSAIKHVVHAQQQLALLQQRQLTCRRRLATARSGALADVLKALRQLACGHRRLAESYKASMALSKRRSRLSDRLQLQRRQREETACSLAAATQVEREAQQAAELKKAQQELLRRQRDKALLAEFRERKLVEEQRQQQRAAMEAEAAREPAHIRRLKAARVQRRQEQHSLRLCEQQLERQERQLHQDLLRHRLQLAADSLKPFAPRDPLRLHRQTAASLSHAEAGLLHRQKQQELLRHRLKDFSVKDSYSCAALMQDIRFRLSTALAEQQLTASAAAQELLLSMSCSLDTRYKPL